MADQIHSIGENATLEETFKDYKKHYTFVAKGTGDIDAAHVFRNINTSYDIELYINGNFNKIADNSFDYYHIKRIYFKGSVKHIGNQCFYGSSVSSVVLPESIETIGHFNFCGEFSSFHIPEKITDFPVDNIIYCQKLTQISVSERNTSYKSVDGILYNYDMTEILFCPNAKSGRVVIPNTVRKIGDYCFYRCSNLTDIVIPTSVQELGDYAFSELTIEKLNIKHSVIKIGKNCFKSSVVKNDFQFSRNVKELPEGAFENFQCYSPLTFFRGVECFGKNCVNTAKYWTLPDVIDLCSAIEIGSSAFAVADSSFELYSSTKEIGQAAFRQIKKYLRIYSFVPFEVDKDAFDVKSSTILYVPNGTKRIYENSIPWSCFSNIVEVPIELDFNDEGELVRVSDDVAQRRLFSVLNSKQNVDRYYLQGILNDVCQNFLYVDNDEDYNAAMEIIRYNRAFTPAIVPDLESRMCQEWDKQYKLRLLCDLGIYATHAAPIIPFEPSKVIAPIEEITELPFITQPELIAPEVQEVQGGSTTVYFNDDILMQLQNRLSLTRKSLKIAVSWFTNYSLFKQVKELAENGVHVQLITNNDLTNNGGYCLDLNKLIDAGVEISLIEYPHLLHHKFCIIDDVTVLNGSYNWTRFSAKNYENLMVIDGNPDVVDQFNAEFEELLANAEHKCIDRMPDYVPERPEYDRSAFRQYVTEELDAEARETSDDRDKITALRKAAKLNSKYLERINPEAKKKYAEAFKVIDDSVAQVQSIVNIAQSLGAPKVSQPADTSAPQASLQTGIVAPKSTPQPAVVGKSSVVTREAQTIMENLKASSLFMVLDVSGSMDSTYKNGHVHNITRKALAASLNLSEASEVAVWTFGSDARLECHVGLSNIGDINRIGCRNEGTNLHQFTSKANSSIQDGALVIIFTDEDQNSIAGSVGAMQARSNVFWQIIVYGSGKEANIKNNIDKLSNTSVVNMTDYASMTDEQITQVLLSNYIKWKQNK